MHVSIAQACKFSENVLRIFPYFHVDVFLPMWPLLSKPLCISMRRRKNVLFSTQSKKKSVNLGTEPVFIVPDTHSEHHLENVFLCLKLCLEQPETLTQNIFLFLEYIVSYACIWDLLSVGVSTAN